MEKVTEKELDYFLAKIDWKHSFLDAKALDIMNRLSTLFKDECGRCDKCAYWEKDLYDSIDPGGRCEKLIEEHWSEVNADYLLVPRHTPADFGCVHFKERSDGKYGDKVRKPN